MLWLSPPKPDQKSEVESAISGKEEQLRRNTGMRPELVLIAGQTHMSIIYAVAAPCRTPTGFRKSAEQAGISFEPRQDYPNSPHLS